MQAEQTFPNAAVGTLGEVLPCLDGDRPLRICLLGYRSHPYGGGQGIYIKYLSKALAEAGHEVDVISGEPYPHLDPRVRLIKMPGMNLYEHGLASLRPRHLTSLSNVIEWTSKLTGGFAEPQTFGRRVVRYLQCHGRDYDIVHDNQCLSFGILRLQRLGVPVVTTIHHPIVRDLQIALAATPRFYQRWLVRRWHSFVYMQQYVARRLDHIVTVSQCSRADIAAAFGLDEVALKLVHCGIDTEVFRPHPEIVRKPRQLIATASADQPLKGLRYLLEAVAALRADYPDIKLTVIGKLKAGGDTERRLNMLGIADCVDFESGISTGALVERYAAAEVAVVPSIYEGFGLPAGEAMACATPLVSTTGGALPEVVGDAAATVGPADSAALAGAIARLFDDPALRARLGRAGRERIEQQFCWTRAAAEMVAFYREVMETTHADR